MVTFLTKRFLLLAASLALGACGDEGDGRWIEGPFELDGYYIGGTATRECTPEDPCFNAFAAYRAEGLVLQAAEDFEGDRAAFGEPVHEYFSGNEWLGTFLGCRGNEFAMACAPTTPAGVLRVHGRREGEVFLVDAVDWEESGPETIAPFDASDRPEILLEPAEGDCAERGLGGCVALE
ncbi:MAG TPA: hypothetical protein RMH85_26795 [Polyangiaceae bacterium LLY-WYZ-15_(1-7)]|nr:hypothetical protein [Myxococcales bacterium]MAT28266.1 hypothetical protein [Sandaracinus sp.]HJK93459.1 hypothetical protein [Polyangiaceae bacterium LLY-WYZ-15_(1-7)]MBJ75290.1 hypothetical protein [Sandaracinus sp.]HJL01044.1 hypothetical protein [Polyangiaceae bacterium LLY-WYZ-15_(1-7)]